MKWNVSGKYHLPGLVLSLVVVLLLGCSSSTDPIPEPGDLNFTFEPVVSVSSYYPGAGQTYRVTTSPSVDLDMEWILNSESVATSGSYDYSADYVRVDTLRAVYSYRGVEWAHTWYANVNQNPSTAPPSVPEIRIMHGEEASSVRVTWSWIAQSTFPIEEYLVAMNYDDPVTAQNWDSAQFLGSHPHLDDQVGYALSFYPDTHGLQAGRQAWFAVRGRDSAGQLSLISQEFTINISSPWLVEGYVYDDANVPIPNAIIDYGCPDCRVNTDATGYYSFGPVPDVAVLDVRTLSRNEPPPGEPYASWYDYSWSGIEFEEGRSYDFHLGSRYGLDEGCDVFDRDFLTYFRHVTRTNQETTLRPNYKLYHWEEYPLKVYVVPDYINGSGLDMSELARETVGFWNIAMSGEFAADSDFFALTEDPEEADVEIYFGNEGSAYAGRAYITEPDDEEYLNGDVIPEKMRVYIWDQLTQTSSIQETTMHELGHVLGLYEHNLCSGGGFLMNVIVNGMLDNGPFNAVHPDEKRVVRMIRNLPQGLDMVGFE